MEKVAFSLHRLWACNLGSHRGLVVLGKNYSGFQAPPSLPVPTADSITQKLLPSVVLGSYCCIRPCNVACQG